jgi:hypothetical protein
MNRRQPLSKNLSSVAGCSKCVNRSRTPGNRLPCQADFTYTISLNVIKIKDTRKRAKSVADDLEAVLRKIEHWHQGSVAGYRISYQRTDGTEYVVEWDGEKARVR